MSPLENITGGIIMFILESMGFPVIKYARHVPQTFQLYQLEATFHMTYEVSVSRVEIIVNIFFSPHN